MLDKQVVVSSSPHVRSGVTTEKIMWQVTLALVPAALAGIYFFGFYALVIISVSVLTEIIVEYLTGRMMGRPLSLRDGSAVLTGLLLAMVIPPSVPLWVPVIGSAFAIAIGKQAFGGLGYNPMNPALLGRAVLLASWPTLMTTWNWPDGSLGWVSGVDGTVGATAAIDAVSGATALGLHKQGVLAELGAQIPYSQLFIGNISGSLGETSALALLIGAAFLCYKRIIDPRIPLTFIGTVVLLSGLFGQDPLFHVLAGGLVIGAFFMATDYVTTPVTPRGKIFFGLGCGLLTMLIRRFGGYPEGVAYSILIMNTATPLLDRYTRPRRFGEVKAARG